MPPNMRVRKLRVPQIPSSPDLRNLRNLRILFLQVFFTNHFSRSSASAGVFVLVQ